MGTGVRASNADIKCGNYFGRIDNPHNLGRAVIHRLGSLSGEPVLALEKTRSRDRREQQAKGRARVAHIDAPTTSRDLPGRVEFEGYSAFHIRICE